jgi:hypothetical protein
VTGYQILRNGAAAASVGGSVLSYADSTLSGSSTYSYAVVAFDGAGNRSSPSSAVQVSTPAVANPSGCPPPATNAFTGCYYNNLTLSGNPVLARTDNQINFDWTTSPNPAVTPGNFSVRWQGRFDFLQGMYSITTIVSDGIRVYVDGQLIFDRWRDQPPYSFLFYNFFDAGTHLITVEYYEHTGSSTAHVSWTKN